MFQVRTGYGRGQCTEAAIASILGVPLEAVPDLWAGPDVPDDAPAHVHQPIERLLAMWAWLKSDHDVMLCGVRLSVRMPVEVAWERSIYTMARAGFHVDSLDWSAYHLASGPNPDGHGHYVVCNLGRVVHDPNPKQRGIINAEHIQWLVPLGLVPDSARDMPSAEWREEDV